MSYTYWKVWYTPYGTGTLINIPEIVKPEIIINLGDAKNSFKFEVNNFAGKYNNYFKPNDRIDIYRVCNTSSTATTDLLMSGTIRNTPVEVTGGKQKLKIEGYDYTEAVLGAITFGDYQQTPINTAIQQGLTFANNINKPNFQVTWDAGNPTTRHIDGAAFPNVGEAFFYAPLKNLVEKYSSNVYTKDDVDYYYFIDNNNNFIWRPRLNTADWSFNIATEDVISYKLAKDLKDTKNFLILKGGILPNGNQVQVPIRDMASIAKHGMKYYISVSNNNNTKKYNSQDLAQSYGEVPPTSSYPSEIEAGTTFTTAWYSSYTGSVKYSLVSSISMTKGSKVTINTGTAAGNKAAYCAVLRQHVVTLLKAEGQAILELYKWGKLKTDIELRPGKVNWSLGDVVQVTIPMLSNSAKPMRIKEIQYTEDTDTYSLEEDVGTI